MRSLCAALLAAAVLGAPRRDAAAEDPPPLPAAPEPAPAPAPSPEPPPVDPPPPAPVPPPDPAAEPEPDDPSKTPFPEPKFRGVPPVPAPGAAGRDPRAEPYVVESVGRVTMLPEGDDVVVVVLVGNPRVTGKELTIKASTMVLWVDRRAGFFGADDLAALSPQGDAKPPAADARPPPPDRTPTSRSVFPEHLLGVYAQGAVDLVSGTLAFRAEEVYLDPADDYALLVEPRLDTTHTLSSTEEVPLFVRAERARVVGRGLAVFDRADVSTSRANDRIELRVRTLTVEEYAVPAPDEETLFGFRRRGPASFRYRAAGIVVRGERVSLLSWPSAAFGLGDRGRTDFPLRLGLSTGKRSSLGYWGLLEVGSSLGPEGDPWLDWTVEVGGYTRRGPAAGVDLRWDRGPIARGRLRTFYVHDEGDEDRNGFEVPNEDRWRVNFEHRSDLSRSLRVDLEANAFSDRGFNREYFESDERNHKERETYARLRWMEGGAAATLTQMAHLRDFRTETLLAPEAGFWSESVPLGGGLDLSSEARAGRLERVFDEDLGVDDYEALRVDVRERVYRPFDLGDVRVSPFAGFRATSYLERTDGGDDLTRVALEAGVRGNLQLHRDYAACGGPLGLDGLRHVVDLDLGLYARAFDEHDPEDVPFFDRHDLEEDRTEVVVGVRNRLETRRPDPAGFLRTSTVVDLRTRVSLWPDDVGPYGKRGPGNLAAKLDVDLVPRRFAIRGEGVFDFGESTLERGSLGVLASPLENVALAGGVRHVHGNVLAVWLDAYVRWSEKWGGRASIVRDLDTGRTNRVQLSVLRFSVDHMFDAGVSVRDDGEDVGFFLNFTPSIGGVPTSRPFDPREEFDYGP